MAVTLTVTGDGHFQGAATNLSDYTVTEESTPLDPSDSSGGVGQLEFTVVEDSASSTGTMLLINDTVELEDGANGRTQGVVNAVTGTDGVARVTANSRLIALMATRTVKAFSGTLQDAFTYYLAVCGITSGIVVDDTIASRAVTFPGWYGNVWDFMKQMCAAQQIEISLVSSNIVLRPVRGRIAETVKNSSESWTLENTDMAQSVEVYYYNNVRKENALVYPVGGWNKDVEVFQVNAAETIETELQVDVSLESIQQPTCVMSVGPQYAGPVSVYTVSGADGLPITPLQWNKDGGSVTVSIGEDTKTIKLKIVGAQMTKYAPYRIAVSPNATDGYSSLRLIGTGVFFNKELVTIPTGVSPERSAQVVGATIENPFITTVAEAYTAGMAAATTWAGSRQSIEVSATVVNRKGETGSVRYPLFSEFDATWPTQTFADFDTAQGTTKTFDDFTAEMYAQVADDFENQAFGNVVGARVKFRDAWYRIRSVTITPDKINYTAEADTIFSDFSPFWEEKTFDDFDTTMTNKTFADLGVVPLWQG